MTTREKLRNLLASIGANADHWQDNVEKFRIKVDLLDQSGKYGNLLKSFFSCKDLNTINSYSFEILFAYDFEANGLSLEYEVKQCDEDSHSIDFRCCLDDKSILFFELRLIQQRNWITQSQKNQLNSEGWYTTVLGGEDEKNETIRLQNLILEKCQSRRGNPIKFHGVIDGAYNFIVVNVSELHLNMCDRADCYLAVYGDRYLPPVFRRGVFGLWDELPDNYTAEILELYKKFRIFRECIHGVMFVKFDGTGNWSRLYLDQGLQYFIVGNNNLVESGRFQELLTPLSFLKKWNKDDE
ncbi:MAG TPA: hypothetical protein VEF34_10565 [Syntrophobacteraceae bacterium]|nr:hypothetical protein [Syntrophobacteraceae bacterium]